MKIKDIAKLLCVMGVIILVNPIAVNASVAKSGTAINDQGLSIEQDTLVEAGKEYSFVTNSNCESSVCYESTGEGYFYFEFCPKDAYGNDLSGTQTSVTKPETFYTNFSVISDGFSNTFDKKKIYNYSTYKTNSISLEKGKKATFKISGYEMLAMSNVSVSYTIKVVQVNPARFETEDNKTTKSADKIKVGKYYSGLISNEGDIDYYVFKAPKSKKYKITVGVTDNNYEYGKVSFKAYKGSKLLKDKSVSLSDKTVTLYSGKLKKGQKIYIKCNLGFGENVTYAGNSFYRIKVK